VLHLLHDHRSTFLGAIVKHERYLLDGHPPRLGELEIGDTGECEIYGDVDGVVSPLNILKGDLRVSQGPGIMTRSQGLTYWIDELIEGIRDIVESDVQRQSLGSCLISTIIRMAKQKKETNGGYRAKTLRRRYN
jgi:hypothetical protein